ncbi:tetratricopeptide repeat protein [Thermodesulfobacteriota bacterium]
MRRIIWLITNIVAFVCISLVSTEAQTDGREELFFGSNQAYREGRYQDAIDGYHQLVKSGHKNGHLYYNLGNAYFRLNRLGRAILNYERARRFIPRDADLNFNLGHARDQIRDAVPTSQGLVSMTFFWLNDLNLKELFLGFAILNVLFWGIQLGRLFLRSEWIYYASLVLLILWLIAGASFGLKWYQLETDDRAVILPEEVNILAGPDIQDTVLFKLHEGTSVHQERSEDGWSLVHLPDGKRGWVVANALEAIKVRVRF